MLQTQAEEPAAGPTTTAPLANVASLQRSPEAPGKAPNPDPLAFVERMTSNDAYIDNNITKVSFFGAEQAIVEYSDGSSLELGLVPRWMKAPFSEVDYHTPRENLNWSANGSNLGIVRLNEIGPKATFGEMQKHAHNVDFVALPVKNGARIVPNRVNMLTAPRLCQVLRHSEDQFTQTTEFVAEFGIRVAGVIASSATATKLAPRGPSPVEADVAAARALAGASPALRSLAAGMEELLATGGTKDLTVAGTNFFGVTVTREGSRLAVKRLMMLVEMEQRGQGQGYVMRAMFEEAAKNVARINGFKTVTIDVGLIVNEGWQVVLKAAGYVPSSDSIPYWIKTIPL
jgi:hypothetical protein